MCDLDKQVYFKTNKYFVREKPNLKNYVRDLFQTPGAYMPQATVCMQYFASSFCCNVLKRLAFDRTSISAKLPDRVCACAGIGRAVHMYHIKVNPPAVPVSIISSCLSLLSSMISGACPAF